MAAPLAISSTLTEAGRVLPSIRLRSCSRCGREFRQVESDRICPSCLAASIEESLRRAPLLGRHLTPREEQVVALLAEGKPNKQIAYALHLTEGTIKEYFNRIFAKTGKGNRLELALWWVCEHCPHHHCDPCPGRAA